MTQSNISVYDVSEKIRLVLRCFFNRSVKISTEFRIKKVCLALMVICLSGCESERDKEWEKWITEIRKVNYRCGIIGDYELKINKAYFFYWPVYEGRSDWESKPPPPLSCSAKLDMMPIEAFWPGMKPAGKRPLSIGPENIWEPDYISIAVRTAPNFVSWDLNSLLKNRLRDGDSMLESYGGHIKTKIGLFRTEKSYRRSSLSSQSYYWEVEKNHSIKTFIECELFGKSQIQPLRAAEISSVAGCIFGNSV